MDKRAWNKYNICFRYIDEDMKLFIIKYNCSLQTWTCTCRHKHCTNTTTTTITTNTTTILWPPGLCPGLPGWAGTRKV